MVLSVAGRTKSNWPGLRTSEHGCAVSCELGWCFVDVLLTVFTDTCKQNFSRTISFHFSSPSKYGIWISIRLWFVPKVSLLTLKVSRRICI